MFKTMIQHKCFSFYYIFLCVFVIQVEKQLTQENYEWPPLVENILNTFTMCW